MITAWKAKEEFEKAMKSCSLPTRLDRFDVLPNGNGVRMVITVGVADTKPIDPFARGTIFQVKSRTYKVVGTDYGARKFKVKCERRPDGRRFKVTPQTVVDGFLFVDKE